MNRTLQGTTGSVLLTLPTSAFAEPLTAGWRSFWTFDIFRDHTINFLWGPIINTKSAESGTFFQYAIPHGWSALWLFYGVIVIVLCVYALQGMRYGWQCWRMRRTTVACAVVLAGLFVILDLRMGLETLSYAKSDYQDFVTKPIEQRELRDRGNLYDAIEAAMPALSERPAYGVISSWPIIGLLSYLTYPSIPYQRRERTDLDTWFVYESPQTTIDDAGNLIDDGTVIARHGRVLSRFGENSFVFRSQP